MTPAPSTALVERPVAEIAWPVVARLTKSVNCAPLGSHPKLNRRCEASCDVLPIWRHSNVPRTPAKLSLATRRLFGECACNSAEVRETPATRRLGSGFDVAKLIKSRSWTLRSLCG